MRKRISQAACGLLAAASLVAFGPAAVDAGEPGPSSPEAPSPFAGAALSDEALSGTRGAAGLAIMGDVGVNLANQAAGIEDNAITAPTTTGSIEGNTVRNVRGVSMFNLNSGNFNSFQNSFQLIIQLDR